MRLHQEGLRPKRLSYAISLALASIMAGNGAYAQQAAPAAVNTDAEVTKVMVVGARASQQSAIDRKKNATTAMDSIIAEDVGAFPDRNVGEAISRISGIALDRGEYGEGVNVTVRGNGPDLTRVEIDGLGVQSGGGSDLGGRGEGRGAELRELSSDLIKSVDVVKGSTAEMTEGSLGGSIRIQTRTGLDFKKRFFSVRASAAQNSINKDWSPDLNLIFADKLLDSRLGVVVNLNKSRAKNESHNVSQGGSNDRAGKIRAIDFDNSPEKTFSFDPSLLTTTSNAGDELPLLNGAPVRFAGTPREILTKAGAARTKDECYAAFPALTTSQTDTVPSGTARQTAVNTRSNELMSCLNQWSDYTPNAIRYMAKQQDDKRHSGDVRFDFKVNNDFTVYAKGSASRREVIDFYNIFSMGGLNPNPGTVVLSGTGQVNTFIDANGRRGVNPAASRFYYPYQSTASYVGNVGTVRGAVANVDPASVTVDGNHHVTKYTITDGSASIDVALGKINTESQYFQTGGTYRNRGLKIEYLLGDAKSKVTRIDKRASGISQFYGESTIRALPNGLYSSELPAGSSFNQLNYDGYARLAGQVASTETTPRYENPAGIPAYTAAQKPLVTPTIGLALQSARLSETGERTGKIDLSYTPEADALSWISAFKGGFSRRDVRSEHWGNGGQTVQDAFGTFNTPSYIPGIYVPTVNLRSSIIGCQDTPGSLGAGGQKCAYGWNPNTDPRNPLSGQMVLTPAEYKNVLAQSLVVPPNSQFYSGAKDRPEEMVDGWYTLDVNKLYEAAGIPNFNLNCIKECVGSDGKTYPQSFDSFQEKVTAGYLMTEFDFDTVPFTKLTLPFGMSIAGNVGYRYVKTNAQGNGYLTFQTIRKVPGVYDAANPLAAGGTNTTTFRRATSIASDTTDFMPIYNLALWVVPDTLVVRYNHAKTIARPGISRLLPSGTCIFDERIADADDEEGGSGGSQRCTGTMGNPALQPFTNSNRNLSVEWYVNKDTMITAQVYKQKGKIGAGNLSVPQQGGRPFADSNAVDPGTGTPLRDLTFDYNQWENQPASTRKGFELGTKTAFTFLPWYLRYTGLDANYTRNESSTSSVNYRDLLSGQSLPVPDEPKYSYNLSLWYDDGAFTARVALQARAQIFKCISPCSGQAVNNFPADGAVNWRVPYNPGSPVFTNSTRFIDAKVAYRFKNGMEVFAEARNLGKSRTTNSTGGYENFASGAPNILFDMYYGARYQVGLVFRTM